LGRDISEKKISHIKGEFDHDCFYGYSCHSAYWAPIWTKFSHIYQGGAPCWMKVCLSTFSQIFILFHMVF